MGSKTWTTTAEFDTGTISGLATAGDELTLGYTPPGAWASGGSLAIAARQGGSCGLINAALKWAGTDCSTGTIASSEEYNGTTWSGGGDLVAALRSMGSLGLQNAALSFGGGGNSVLTEEYDGGTWASGGNLTVGREDLQGFGTQGAGVACGGDTPAFLDTTEEYDGTNWSSVNAMLSTRSIHACAGTLLAGIAFGGSTASGNYKLDTEEYDGTNWSAGGNMSLGRGWLGGAGTQNAALSIGGLGATTSYTAKTEEYNGIAWSNGGDLSIARHTLGAAGTQPAALAFGGYDGSIRLTSTEEYIQPSATSGTWTIDVDGSAVVTFSPIACNIGSTVQARIKTAANQAGLGAATWVPATGYYTAFPAIVTAAMNQWSRLEFSLSGVETVQDITLSWVELLFGGNPSQGLGLGISRKLQL